jgi:hypothetical protein
VPESNRLSCRDEILTFRHSGRSRRSASCPTLFQAARIRFDEEVRVSDEDFYICVSDFQANHIKVFGPDGRFRTTIGRKGQGPGGLSGPSNIEISGFWPAKVPLNSQGN